MFRYLIIVKPLGLMYGSAGGFLSPENLVGQSRSKFPPDAATLSGLIFSQSKAENEGKAQDERNAIQEDLRKNVRVGGPFWAEYDSYFDFYVPIPWLYQVKKHERDPKPKNNQLNYWKIGDKGWELDQKDDDFTPEFSWQPISAWNDREAIRENAAAAPWKFVPLLHPHLKDEERNVKKNDGLFLEYAVQLPEEYCLIYLSTVAIAPGWYRFGGENHLVEIESEKLDEDDPIVELFQQKIDRAFASIAPGVWGSNRFSYRYPQHPDFPEPSHLLTDKPIPYRYRTGNNTYQLGGSLGRGRYAVPPGSVYLLERSLNRSWWDWDNAWFPKEGFPLNHLGCGLALPLQIEGVS
ncbi:MAG: type III-B CRISPR module-associated Cmr3 family protein [Cyanobacteria bacterium P01_E01_bin.42]